MFLKQIRDQGTTGQSCEALSWYIILQKQNKYHRCIVKMYWTTCLITFSDLLVLHPKNIKTNAEDLYNGEFQKYDIILSLSTEVHDLIAQRITDVPLEGKQIQVIVVDK